MLHFQHNFSQRLFLFSTNVVDINEILKPHKK